MGEGEKGDYSTRRSRMTAADQTLQNPKKTTVELQNCEREVKMLMLLAIAKSMDGHISLH